MKENNMQTTEILNSGGGRGIIVVFYEEKIAKTVKQFFFLSTVHQLKKPMALSVKKCV